jgi:hypothetical protein
MRLLNQDSRTPLLFRLSASDKFVLNEDFSLTGAAELVHPTDNVEWVNMGLEMQVLKYIALRGGHRLNVDEGKWSLGLGFIPPVLGGFSTRVDYSFHACRECF